MSNYTVAIAAGGVVINGKDIGAITAAASGSDRNTQMIVAINAQSGTTGVTASAVGATSYKLTAADGRNIDLTSNLTTAATTVNAFVTGFAVSTGIAVTNYGQLTLNAGKDIVIGTAAIAGIAAASYLKSGSSTVDVSSQTLSSAAIAQIDTAIDTINTQRASLGTVQSRFASVIANLHASSENLSAARGRIRDTDFAAETANMTRNQVLQQAGVAMLAQANALPNIVLSLLK